VLPTVAEPMPHLSIPLAAEPWFCSAHPVDTAEEEEAVEEAEKVEGAAEEEGDKGPSIGSSLADS
jgi:hypothetical protein